MSSCSNVIHTYIHTVSFYSFSSLSSLASPQSSPQQQHQDRGDRPHVELGGLQGAGGPRAPLGLAGAGQEREGGEECWGGGKLPDGKVNK